MALFSVLDLEDADLEVGADSLLCLLLDLPLSFVCFRSFVSLSLLFVDFDGAFVADPHIAVAGRTEAFSFSVFFDVCVPPFGVVPLRGSGPVGDGGTAAAEGAVVGEIGGLSVICGHASVGGVSFFCDGIFQAGFVGAGRTTTELLADPGVGTGDEWS